MSITSLISGNVIYTLFDDGLANFLGLETLRHGTNIVNNIGIRFLGLQPSHGSKAGGVIKHWNPGLNDYHKNKVSVFTDSQINDEDSEDEDSGFFTNLSNGFLNRFYSRFFCALSGYSLITDNFNKTAENRCKKVTRVFLSSISLILNVLISPTLKFRFNEIEKRFKISHHSQDTYVSSQPIEPWRIGLLGTVLTGINFNWFARVRAKPIKAFTGVVQLTAAVALSILCVSTIMSNPVTIGYAVAGAILA